MVGKEIDSLVTKMTTRDLLVLVERLVEELREREEGGSPQSLEGALQGIADPDFDIDAALSDIRLSWQRDLKDLS